MPTLPWPPGTGAPTADWITRAFTTPTRSTPSLLNIITGRLAANRNFQRVRGTLRLLGNTLLDMQASSSQATLAHPCHVNPRVARIRDEVVNRPGFSQLDPAIESDIIGSGSTAEENGQRPCGTGRCDDAAGHHRPRQQQRLVC